MPKIRRDLVVFALIVIGFIGIAVRAYYVQVVKTDFLQEEAEKRQIRDIAIPAPRGAIYDRHGSLLALSTPMASVWLDPKVITQLESDYLTFLKLINLTDPQLNKLAERNRYKRLSFIRQINDSDLIDKLSKLDLPGVYIKQIELNYSHNGNVINVNKSLPSVWVNTNLLNRYRYTFDKLAKHLDLDRTALMKKVYRLSKKRFLYVRRGLVPDLAEKIESLHLNGVYTQGEYRRYYPAGESSANLIGFTNIDDKGIEGIELAYDSWLKGTPGKKQVLKDRAGHVIDFVKDIKDAKPGNQLNLSIDQNLQYFTYRSLKKVMIEHQALSASSVILDAKTGEILSMVSLPSFNPNDSAQRRGPGIKNRVITDLIEPGSPMKPFIIAKALHEGVIDENTVIDTSPGSIRIQGNRISDTSRHGELTPLEIIQKSSNVGVSKIALMMKPEQQREFWADIGIGQESGLFLPGENHGYLKPGQEWQPIDQASASFGYGFNTNLLDLAHSYLLFANHGEMLPLSILKLNEAPQGHQVIESEIADSVLTMMESVVAQGGTAPKAQIPGYRVAGKTGTVHKTKSRGGYKENTYLSLFAGIVPVSDPDMVMIVLINEPSRGVYYGGSVAAPAFREVMSEALRLRNVSPDQLVEGS
ncbi:peptidoglycan D,D-transpeptidase FtsI family protein [Thiomicrorhabdus sediminis]|uniref:Peptidoglycan D,D-transpeptidase FtsI n=1 Tax=Thiomicrorhabdus sediminis TaxID=2580412 RepID=A0A4V1HHY5_9GAMM|nr:penicillin-binding protein 2 [Thiomicrorhabdus sediminis]QCU90643.1 penicillin-binding protein 2 [Thiomicrorhabdus sediminis]